MPKLIPGWEEGQLAGRTVCAVFYGRRVYGDWHEGCQVFISERDARLLFGELVRLSESCGAPECDGLRSRHGDHCEVFRRRDVSQVNAEIRFSGLPVQTGERAPGVDLGEVLHLVCSGCPEPLAPSDLQAFAGYSHAIAVAKAHVREETGTAADIHASSRAAYREFGQQERSSIFCRSSEAHVYRCDLADEGRLEKLVQWWESLEQEAAPPADGDEEPE